MLDDGTNIYTYGNPSTSSGQSGRISQVNTAAEYYLGDALGSVRQMSSAGADVVLGTC